MPVTSGDDIEEPVLLTYRLLFDKENIFSPGAKQVIRVPKFENDDFTF